MPDGDIGQDRRVRLRPAKGPIQGLAEDHGQQSRPHLWRDRRDRQAESGEFGNLEQRDPPPDEAFDRIWMQEHLWHCLRELREEVDQQTYLAFQHYVIEQWPIERVCDELNLKPSNVYTIKWRLTKNVSEKMKTLLDGME